jgi:hypothetical protein
MMTVISYSDKSLLKLGHKRVVNPDPFRSLFPTLSEKSRRGTLKMFSSIGDPLF